MKVVILGKMNNDNAFDFAEEKIRKEGNIPINPMRVLYALPDDITNSDFIAVLLELVRISDAVYLGENWKSDLASTIAKTNAERLNKVVIKCQ